SAPKSCSLKASLATPTPVSCWTGCAPRRPHRAWSISPTVSPTQPTRCAGACRASWAGAHACLNTWSALVWRMRDDRFDRYPGGHMNLHLNCCTADQLSAAQRQRILELADAHRQADPAFAHWAAGYGVIRHDPLTQLRVRQMVDELVALGR